MPSVFDDSQRSGMNVSFPYEKASSGDSTIDTRPASVNLKVYAGDATSLRLNVSGADYSGASWTGQVRLNHDAAVDATFTITPDSTGATIVLPAAQTQQLLDAGAPETPVEKSSLVRYYHGVWDVQVQTGPSVKTLVQGLIEVYADVTKVV
jgi:hypothetical protein